MAAVVPKTVGESLYWSYANLAMAAASFSHDEPEYQKTDYIIRNKIYYGLLRGTLKLGSFFNDEKLKVLISDSCCYCSNDSDLTLDHLIPQIKGGKHSADNLVVACRSCNSSKRALDLLEWSAKRGEFPALFLLRRYPKLAIHYCRDNGLMGVTLASLRGEGEPRDLFSELMPSDLSATTGGPVRWPFAVELLPPVYPRPEVLRARAVTPDDDA